MSTDSLVERLSHAVTPVRRRSILRDAAALAALAAIELGIFLSLGFMRPDMPEAMERPSFWWKLVSMGLIAALGTAVALLSVDPTRSPRRGLRWLLIVIVASLGSGWIIDALRTGLVNLIMRLDWVHGLQCVWKMVALSVPAALALGILIRRGAPTDRPGTALAAGVGSAAWGAFIFVFACPSDDPLYIAVWYTIGCGLVAAIARFALLRLSRW